MKKLSIITLFLIIYLCSFTFASTIYYYDYNYTGEAKPTETWLGYGMNFKEGPISEKIKDGWNNYGTEKIFVKNGKCLVNSWLELDNESYYFDYNGFMVTGWRQIKNKKYYFNKKGQVLTGTKIIDGETKLFDKTGALLE